MFTVNSLFEAWLRQATEKPLPAWKRIALIWRLQEDEELRCYAAELAQFSHELEPSKGLSAADQAWMRERLRARLNDPKSLVPNAWQSQWTSPVAALLLGALVFALVLWFPHQVQVPQANTQAASSAQGEALALPTASPTATLTKTPGLEDSQAVAKATTVTAVP